MAGSIIGVICPASAEDVAIGRKNSTRLRWSGDIVLNVGGVGVGAKVLVALGPLADTEMTLGQEKHDRDGGQHSRLGSSTEFGQSTAVNKAGADVGELDVIENDGPSELP